jgi:DNA mismatch repair protein MutS2
LILTGPNTGGKSVALKTLGLCALMAQSGIPILARSDAALPFFDWVWCDIGDQQSVAADLSTFSGHIANLGEILRGATSESLVLLDEPGTGTDPDDGAALAKAMLRELVGRGARVLATSHFHAVKILALTLPGARTAGVDFDPETFSPRYRLIYDSVGPSLGLTMARRLGLPAALLDAAEGERGAHAVDLSTAIAQLEAERRRYEDATERCEAERLEMHTRRQAHEALAAELRDKKARKWADELADAREFADELRREGRRLLAEAKRAPASFARPLAELGNAQTAAIAQKVAQLGPPDEGRSAAAATRPLAIGDQVEVVGSGLRGSLVKLSGERAQLARGALRFDVPVQQLRHVAGSNPKSGPARSPHVSIGVSEPARPSHRRSDPGSAEGAAQVPPPIATAEINLVGERVREAIGLLEPFLDRAVLEERAAVRIIHGFGTGALRNSVHEYLARSPHVERFAPAGPESGGGGATIAYLR